MAKKAQINRLEIDHLVISGSKLLENTQTTVGNSGYFLRQKIWHGGINFLSLTISACKIVSLSPTIPLNLVNLALDKLILIVKSNNLSICCYNGLFGWSQNHGSR